MVKEVLLEQMAFLLDLSNQEKKSKRFKGIIEKLNMQDIRFLIRAMEDKEIKQIDRRRAQ